MGRISSTARTTSIHSTRSYVINIHSTAEPRSVFGTECSTEYPLRSPEGRGAVGVVTDVRAKKYFVSVARARRTWSTWSARCSRLSRDARLRCPTANLAVREANRESYFVCLGQKSSESRYRSKHRMVRPAPATQTGQFSIFDCVM